MYIHFKLRNKTKGNINYEIIIQYVNYTNDKCEEDKLRNKNKIITRLLYPQGLQYKVSVLYDNIYELF